MLDSGTPLLSNRDIALTAEFPLKKITNFRRASKVLSSVGRGF